MFRRREPGRRYARGQAQQFFCHVRAPDQIVIEARNDAPLARDVVPAEDERCRWNLQLLRGDDCWGDSHGALVRAEYDRRRHLFEETAVPPGRRRVRQHRFVPAIQNSHRSGRRRRPAGRASCINRGSCFPRSANPRPPVVTHGPRIRPVHLRVRERVPKCQRQRRVPILVERCELHPRCRCRPEMLDGDRPESDAGRILQQNVPLPPGRSRAGSCGCPVRLERRVQVSCDSCLRPPVVGGVNSRR